MRRLTLATRAAGLAVAVLALGVDACAEPASAPLPSEGAPGALDIAAGYFGSGSTRVRLEGGQVVYTHYLWGVPPDSTRAVVTPDAAAWRAFWRAVDGAGLGTWPRECANRDLVDGGGYRVVIEHAAGRIDLTTSNASPGRGGRCDRSGQTADEAAFLAAVSALVGRPFPGQPTPR